MSARVKTGVRDLRAAAAAWVARSCPEARNVLLLLTLPDAGDPPRLRTTAIAVAAVVGQADVPTDFASFASVELRDQLGELIAELYPDCARARVLFRLPDRQGGCLPVPLGRGVR
jgi:hypothetical protein